MNENQALQSFKKLQVFGIALLVIGAVGFGVGFMGARQPALQSYLFAYVFWVSITLGCFGLSMLHHMIRGRWAKPVLRLLEAGGGPINLAVMGLLFLPILAMMPELYPWARPEYHWGPLDSFKHFYLQTPFFIGRLVVYYVIWIGLSALLRRSSHEQDRTGDPAQTEIRASWAAPGLVVFLITVNFAFTDWVMSLDPRWYSTIYGLWYAVGQGLGATSLITIIVTQLHKKYPYSEVITPQATRDLGNVMLTFTMFWGYFSLSQFLIIYSGNLPEEIKYYLNRMEGVFWGMGTYLVVFQFFVPFVLLCSGNNKRVPKQLGAIAALILFTRIVDHFWTIVPFFHHGARAADISAYWVAAPAFLMFAGVWFLLFTIQVPKAPLVPRHDVVPAMDGDAKEALEHA